MSEKDSIRTKSVYRVGAEYGLWFGIYLSLMSLAVIYGFTRAWLMLVALAMLAAIPAVVYQMMSYYRREVGVAPFATLWMLGLSIFLFGSIICGAVTYMWMEFVLPTFIYDQVMAAIELYKSVPGDDAAKMVEIMQAVVDHHALPTPIEVVVQMIMLVTFLGSLLSMALAGLIGMRRIPPRPPFKS